MNKRTEQIKKYGPPVLCAVVVLFLINGLFYWAQSEKTASNDDLEDGLSYIQSMEKADFSTTEVRIKEIKKQDRKNALANSDADIWQQLNDAVILGDSRAVDFYYDDFLERKRVLAEVGATIRNVSDHKDELTELNPSSVFLCYGLNDIEVGVWQTADDYIEELGETLDQLHEQLPNAVVYVNSIIPATDAAVAKTPIYGEIPDWNMKIKAYCEEKSIPYVDVTKTAETYSADYDVDGVHMKPDFYYYWAIDMIAEVNENE